MTRKFISIRDKFTLIAVRILLVLLTTLSLLGVGIGLVAYRTTVQREYTVAWTALTSKGKLLVINNSRALFNLAQDNAFSAIRDLIVTTVREDHELQYGIYMDAERRPWVYYASENHVAPPDPVEPLSDSVSMWVASLAEPAFRIIQEQNQRVVEFAAPIRNDEGLLGYIRYAISTKSMEENLKKNEAAALRSRLLFPLGILILCAIIFLFEYRSARTKSDEITKPLHELTKASKDIASGSYNTPITTNSNDEVGELAGAFETMRKTMQEYTQNLESKVAKRTEELRAAQAELVEKAHRAGMADIATGTLHNVGNILNSVKASVDVINELVGHSAIDGLTKANSLMREHMPRIVDFMQNDARGPKLIQYYMKLEEGFREEHDQIHAAALRLSDKVNAIAEVISAQQNYAGVAGLAEEVSLAMVIEDALTMQSGSIDRYHIAVERQFAEVPPVMVQKTKLVHILINLIKNAKEAMIDTEPDKRKITIVINRDEAAVYVRVIDNGMGISPENLTRIFNHGFTTKKDGHGFGLHSSANYMTEMGGGMWSESAGAGTGSVFVLKFSRLV